MTLGKKRILKLFVGVAIVFFLVGVSMTLGKKRILKLYFFHFWYTSFFAVSMTLGKKRILKHPSLAFHHDDLHGFNDSG